MMGAHRNRRNIDADSAIDQGFPAKRLLDFARVLAVFSVLSMLSVACFSLCGCRYSDTLLEIIRDQNTGVLDENVEALFHEVEGAPLNTELASVHLSENENFANQSNFLPVYKEDAEANRQAVRRVHDQTTVDKTDASEGDEAGDSDERNSSTAEETEETDEPSSATESEDPAEDENNSNTGDSNQAPDETSGRGGTGKLYNDGTYEDLPDARAVAAKGSYAFIVQMLAGKGGLAAADASWIDNVQKLGIFPNEGIADIKAAWDKNGTLDVGSLIESRADVILVDGVEASLTDAQREKLLAAGINVVTVPPLGQTYTSDSEIVTAVKVTGQVLSGLNSDATFSTADMVEKYIELHDSAIKGCLNANGGYSYKMVVGRAYQGIYQGTSATGEDTTRLSSRRITTACIDSWTKASKASLKAKREFGFHEIYLHDQMVDASDGVGLSACTVGGNFVLSDYYLQVAGVVNNAYDSAKPVSATEDSEKTLPYAVVAGSQDGVTARQVGQREVPSPLWYSQTGVSATDLWECVGDQSFPGVIVRDGEIAKSLSKSAAKKNGLYNVGQRYSIYQMPSGIAGNWFDGSVESFLISVWAYGVFQEGTTNNAAEWVNGFYQLFYRISGSASTYLSGFGETTTAQCPTKN